jgi:hypothetical protein
VRSPRTRLQDGHQSGETELVLANRAAYQNTLRTALVAGVEEISGRHVRAFLSANHIAPDYAVETFILDSVLT